MDVIPFRDKFNFLFLHQYQTQKTHFKTMWLLLESSHEFIWVDLKTILFFTDLK
jgi:hypothetical protein